MLTKHSILSFPFYASFFSLTESLESHGSSVDIFLIPFFLEKLCNLSLCRCAVVYSASRFINGYLGHLWSFAITKILFFIAE